jgi:hypothetical protein
MVSFYQHIRGQKFISRTFKVRAALVFLCPKERERGGREGEREREERREKREEREERREKRDERREMREQVSERIKVRAIIFLNRPGLG